MEMHFEIGDDDFLRENPLKSTVQIGEWWKLGRKICISHTAPDVFFSFAKGDSVAVFFR